MKLFKNEGPISLGPRGRLRLNFHRFVFTWFVISWFIGNANPSILINYVVKKAVNKTVLVNVHFFITQIT